MDWITKMNAAVAYLEENLDGDIDLAEAGRRAGCSAYHFQRVFSYMAGVTPAEYVRRRRLTLAAFDLQSGEEKVIDVAVKYGYDSPTSFARAFGALHGVAPSEAKEKRSMFVAYPPISFQITIQGVSAMNYRIENRDAFRVVGVKKTTVLKDDDGSILIPKFWQETFASGMGQKILGLIDSEPHGMLGLSQGDWSTNNQFDYYIAAPTTKPVPEGMVEFTVPAATWAVFESVGPMPDALQQLQRRIFTEWLPTSGYEYAAAPDIEVYGPGDQSAADYKCQVWLPIEKKK